MKKTRKLLAVLLAAAVALTFTAGCGGKGKTEAGSQTTSQTDTQKSVTAPKTIKLQGKKYEIKNDVTTYLILGTDHSGDEEKTGDEYVGSMADFILLAVFDHTKKTYASIQINRDTIAEINLIDENGKGDAIGEEQITTAHWYGGTKEMGCENTVRAVKRLLGGIDIDGYYSLPMDDIPKLNHLVNGVTVNVTDDFSQEDPGLTPGKHHLTDQQAKIFVQARMDVGDGENTSRMRRQREYMTAFSAKMKAKLKKNSSFLNDAFQALKENATTNISDGAIANLGSQVSEYEDLGVFQPEGKTKVTKDRLGDGLEHTEFYMSAASKKEILTKVYSLTEAKEED